MKIKLLLLLSSLLIVKAQEHGHLNAGAIGRNQNEKLIWQNGADFVAETGYVKTMLPSSNTKTLGLFDGGITMTAGHMTNGLGEPILNSAAPGAFLLAEIVSLEGPTGGVFSFWETNSVAGAPTFSLASGAVTNGLRFDLSQANLNAGQPGADPFGHIHGRRMTLSQPGIYTLGVRAIDVSTNGASAGPIHTPSDILKIQFQAGINIKSIERFPGMSMITVGSLAGRIFTLQWSTNFADTNSWQDLEEATGNDLFMMMHDNAATNPARFYRVKMVTPQ